MDVLLAIKRLVFRRNIVFTRKAEAEMEVDGLTKDDVVESIVTAQRIDKVHPVAQRNAQGRVSVSMSSRE